LKRLLVCIFIIASHFAFSQSARHKIVFKRIDSLLSVKTTGNDTLILYKLSNLGRLYLEVRDVHHASEQVNLAMEFISANEGRLTKQNNIIGTSFLKYKSNILRTLGGLQWVAGNYTKAAKHFEDGIKIDSKLNHKSGLANGYENLGNTYYNLGKYPDAIEKLNLALRLYTDLNYRSNKANTLRNLGNVYKSIGQYSKAGEYYKESLKLREELKEENLIASMYVSLGLNYSESGDYATASEYFIKSLKLCEQLQDTIALAYAYVNLAVNYNRETNYDRCIDNNLKAYKLYEAINNTKEMPLVLNNLGIAYTGKKEYTKAIEYYNRGLALCEANGNLSTKAYILGNIGVLHQGKKDEDNALKYYLETLKILEQLNNKTGIILSLTNIGIIYCQVPGKFSTLKDVIKRLELSETYMLRAYNMATEFGSKEILRNVHSGMAQLYSAKGDAAIQANDKAKNYKKALEHTGRQMALNDSLLNEQITKQSLEMNSKYESEKKEHDNEILAKQNAIQKYELNQKNYFIYGLLIAVLLIILFAALFIRQNKLKANQKTIELEQKLLRTQLNPHFIFNSLNAIQNYIYKNDAKNAGGYLSKFSVLMRMILDNSRQEFISLEKEIEGLKIYLELQALRFENRFEYAIETDRKLETENISIPPMLAQPFIENSIEHGLLNKKEKGKIAVRFIKSGENILFEVEDDGIGREKAAELKKERNVTHKSLATRITIERLSVLNKGNKKKIELNTIDLKNEDGSVKGTKVVFNIPYVEN